ncbi:MAG: hypothetical protein ACREK8_01755 [Gemmatimonadales bacterium]
MRQLTFALGLLVVPVAMPAQKPLPAARQIALAVLPLPREFQADATVLGYNEAGKLVTLRAGKGVMICLASDPKDATTFHVACYQNSMEPFMARGRALRAGGANDAKVDSVRFAEARSGRLRVPKQAAALWTLTGPWSGVNVAAGTISAAIRPLYEVYMPYATAASTGIPVQPTRNGPWLMDPGTPKAHIMFAPSM